jgi:geranylgeranyl reductase family protein
MSTTEEWEVAVIGGGPAGLAAASTSASAGARTIVLERMEHPRYKTCGGGLIGTSLSAVSDMQIPVRDEIYAATFTLHGRHEFTRTHQTPFLKMVLRAEFDDVLRRRAIADGVTLLERTRVRAISQNQHNVQVRLSDGSNIEARVAIGADGSAGVTARHVGVDTYQVDLGLEAEVSASASVRGNWRGRVLLDWGKIPGSYAWIFPKDELLTVGVIAARGSGEDTRRYLDDVLLRHELESCQRIHESGHLTKCRTDASPLRRGRVIVAGDAAGLLEPWTREGISYALRSGLMAGSAAAEASVAGPERLDQSLDRYVSAVHAELIPEMRAGRRLLQAFSRHPAAFHLGMVTPKGWQTFVEFCQGEESFVSVMRHRSVRAVVSLISRM